MTKNNSGYTLSKVWFDFVLDNPDIVTGNHTALYVWIVELNNRLKWVDKFGLTVREAMDGMACKSRTTYLKCFNDLIEWGFIIMVVKSKNQYQCNVIAISKNVQPRLYKNYTDTGTITNQSTGTISSTDTGTIPQTIKLLNIETIKHIVVVEYAQAFDFFIQSRNCRVLCELHKIEKIEIENFFKRFYDEKIGGTELNNKTPADMVKHFTNWLPYIIESNNKILKNQKNGKSDKGSAIETIITTGDDFIRTKHGHLEI